MTIFVVAYDKIFAWCPIDGITNSGSASKKYLHKDSTASWEGT